MTVSAEQLGVGAGMVTLLAILLAASTIYGLGYRLAVMRRARADYHATREALPKLRRGFFTALWQVAKVAFWVGLGLFVLVAWAVADARRMAGR